jgi:hypothetical protein
MWFGKAVESASTSLIDVTFSGRRISVSVSAQFRSLSLFVDVDAEISCAITRNGRHACTADQARAANPQAAELYALCSGESSEKSYPWCLTTLHQQAFT